MKILITGSSGFIVQHHCNDLSEHNEIVPYDLKDGKDVRDLQLKDVYDVQLVIHLAALCDVRDSVNRPKEYWDVNVKGSKRVFDIVHDHNSKEINMNCNVIYASSSCAKEFWLSPYGYTKKVMESHAKPGMVGCRFTTVYGEGARSDMLVSRLINKDIKYVTDQKRDYIHVDDVVKFIRLLSIVQYQSHYTKRKYDVGTGKSLNNTKLVTAAKMEVPVVEGDSCEMQDNEADITHALKLGWMPMEEVLDYIRENTRS